ncbi:MAG: hypothetical protein RJA22_559 [Verrucomicrobiota bacterium]|jgi:hypothetical protein
MISPILRLTILPLVCALVLSGWLPCAQGQGAAEEMAGAAKAFLAALDNAGRMQATYEFKSDERFNWHYIPKDRKGVALKDLTPEQRQLALRLLASGLSAQGFNKATNIMALESVLAGLEGAGRRFPRDPALYHVWIFGQPDAKGTWAWRFEGHHLSASFTVVKGQYFASTPSFMGSNPAEVRTGPRKGLRVLAGEEDAGRRLVQALTAEQRKVAVFSTNAPKEIFSEAKRRAVPLEPAGVAAAQLEPAQRQLLMALVREYVLRTRPDVAEQDLRKIQEAGWDKVTFAWAGGMEKGQGHYYRVQGPTFLLEYDNTQNDNNHIHAVWRDFNGDYGEDLLRRHHAEAPH